MPELTRYTTIARAFHHEPAKVKGSRFLADLTPVVDEAGAQAALEAARAATPDASHHCYAWILDPAGRETRAFDDGEPGGSAGLPILRQLEGHGISGVICVVARYFGGTKLGVGGLMRAYGGAAGEAIDRAELVSVRIQRKAVIEYPYEVSGPVEGLLAAVEARTVASEYGAAVHLEVVLPLDRFLEFQVELTERTAGRAVLFPDD